MLLFLFTAALLLVPSAQGAEVATKANPMLASKPAKVIRLEKRGRMPASMDTVRAEKAEANRQLDEALKVGSHAIIRNSTDEWNNQVALVVARFEDGSRKIKLDDGTFARIAFDNLHTLSPETDRCCKSSGVNICRNDRVYHPVPSTSLGVPVGKVRRLFENCAAVVRDGLDFIYDAKQLGKAVDCSPQKEAVCVGKVVYVEAYRNGKRYEFEGPVDQVFTNGTILVRTGLWLLPVDATTVKVQTDTLHSLPVEGDSGSVITSRDGQRKIFVPVQKEVEPFDANISQGLFEEHGISVPAR